MLWIHQQPSRKKKEKLLISPTHQGLHTSGNEGYDETQQLIISRNATSASTSICVHYVIRCKVQNNRWQGRCSVSICPYAMNTWKDENFMTLFISHSILPCKR